MCHLALESINSLRMTWPSAETARDVHSRTYPLMYTLKTMNTNQGLGFVIFSVRASRSYSLACISETKRTSWLTCCVCMCMCACARCTHYLDHRVPYIFQRVVDTKTVNLLFLSMLSFLFSAVSLLVGLGTNHWDHRVNDSGGEEANVAMCEELSAAQLAGLEAWQLMANTSCTYNVTIGPDGVGLIV